MSKWEEFCSLLLGTIGWIASIALIASGFEKNNNPGLPVAGAILVFTFVYADLKKKENDNA